MQAFFSRLMAFCQKHRTILQWACVVGLAAAFFGGSVFFGPVSMLSYCSGWPERKVLLLVFTALYIAVMACYLIWKKPDWTRFLYVLVLMMVALVIRIALFNQLTADYVTHLKEWVKVFKAEGFAAITKEIGDYNLPYQYILAVVANIPINPLYQIKVVSVMFDFAMALLLMGMTDRFLHKRYGMVVLTAVLLMPTLWFNGAFWAQCDAIYVFFVMACLYAMLADRPVLSVVMLTIAFSFKIQTVFFFPMVLFGLLHKKYKLRHALVFVVAYMLLLVPALLMGRSLVSALSIYFRQAAQYNDRLTYNAVNVYQFMPFGEVSLKPEYSGILQYFTEIDRFAWGEWWTTDTVRYLQASLVPYAGMVVLALVFYLYNNRKHIQLEHVWMLALTFTLLIPLILPKMHDRYFMLAEFFALLYAVRYPKRWFIPVLVIWASFESYMPFIARERPMDMRIAAAMMMAAMGVVLWDLIRAMRAGRARDKAEKAEMEEPYTI